MPEPLGDPKELAEFLRRDEGALANWRYQGIGPPYVKVHGRILYDWADVHAWLAGQKVDPQVDPRLIGA